MTKLTSSLIGRLRVTAVDWSGDESLYGLGPTSTTPFTEEQLDELRDAGKASVVFEGENMITDWGLSLISRLPLWAFASGGGSQVIKNSSGASKTVTSIANASVLTMKIGDASNPSSPALTDTSLYDSTPVATLNTTTSAPLYNKIVYSATIPAADGDPTGYTMYEEGLFFKHDGSTETLFARIIFPAGVSKIAGQGIQFDHSILFTNS
jgi:hypothetical protein